MERNHLDRQDFTLIDALLPLAESWKFVLLPPLALSVLAFVAAQFFLPLPVSVATVQLPEAAARALLQDDGADASTPSFTVAAGATEDESLVFVNAPTAQADGARFAEVTRLLHPAAKVALAARREAVRTKIAETESYIARQTQIIADLASTLSSRTAQTEIAPGALADLARSAADILHDVQQSRVRLDKDRAMLALLSGIDPISLPDDARPDWFLALLTFGLALFVMLGAVFVREEFRRASAYPGGRHKIERLRNALMRMPRRD